MVQIIKTREIADRKKVFADGPFVVVGHPDNGITIRADNGTHTVWFIAKSILRYLKKNGYLTSYDYLGDAIAACQFLNDSVKKGNFRQVPVCGQHYDWLLKGSAR